MLSSNPAVSPPPMELRPPPQSVPARALQPQVAILDDGHVSPRQQLERRAPTPGSPFQPSQKQQPQHGLNAPRPSLSPLSEYHSGFADEDLDSPSPSPSPFSIANHRRQHSFPNLLPLAFRSRTPSPTRKTHTRSPSEQMPYTGDGRSNGRTAAGSPRGGGGGLASWLSGSSAAASALGLSHTTSKDAATPETTPTHHRGPGSTTSDFTTTPKSTMTTASRFMSALSSRFNPTTPTSSPYLTNNQPNNAIDDELYSLNIEAALFPNHPSPPSPTSPRDAFSPSAFKNLHMNAVGLLTRMQAAYREQAHALRELRAERAAQADELEEAVTRARHLKMQLEGMAARAQEQEGVVRGLVEELANERKARARVEEEVRVLKGVQSEGEGASMVSEDLGVDEERRKRRRKRRSGKGGEGGGDEEEEEEEEMDDDDESAESESVFSRCRSPALPAGHAAGALSDGASSVMGARVDGGVTPSGRAGNGNGSASATPKQKAGQQMSAFQKMWKGISGESAEEAGCANCKGQDASVAWDTVGLLRDENRHLKRRVGELEVAVEGALDLVNGIGL